MQNLINTLRALIAGIILVLCFGVIEITAQAAPVADAGGPYLCTQHQNILLDGSGSQTTPPGGSLTYGWDLNNDGLFEDSSSITPVFSCGGDVVGTIYNVCLQVTDTSGLNDTDCSTVTVVLVVPPSPTPPAIPLVSIFYEPFADNSAGWTLGNEWQIGPAFVSSGQEASSFPDPGTD